MIPFDHIPSGHGEHIPVLSIHLPSTHVRQIPFVELHVTHPVHGVHVVAAAAAENVFVGHGEHSGAPSDNENVPAVHAVHDVELCAEEYPAVQFTHADAPSLALKLPAVHAVHPIPPALNVPAAHFVQSVTFFDPTMDVPYPAVHGVHVPDPSVVEYVPSGHIVQFAAPVFANVPAAQMLQFVLPYPVACHPASHIVQFGDVSLKLNVPGLHGMHIGAPA